MYYCNHCHEIFEEPECVVERHGFNDGLYEELFFCPFCGDGDFEGAEQCCECGNWMPESQGKYSMCEACESDTSDKLRYFLYNEFNECEREFIYDNFDIVVTAKQVEAV